MKLEDVIVVTNDVEYEVPPEGLVVPYFVRCSDEELPSFKAEVCEVWRRQNELGNLSSTVAGMVRGGLHPHFCRGLKSGLWTYGVSWPDSNYVYDRNVNPVRAFTYDGSSEIGLFLWGASVVKNGVSVDDVGLFNIRSRSCDVDTLTKLGVEFKKYGLRTADGAPASRRPTSVKSLSHPEEHF